jgi:hypothetical protein
MDPVEVWLTPAQLETLQREGRVNIPGARIGVSRPK